MMPLGAATTNTTSMMPSTSTLTSEEMVTARSCCVVPSRIAPSTGPIQCAVPPISAIASTETEYLRLKADDGSAYCRYIAAGASAAEISTSEHIQATRFI